MSNTMTSIDSLPVGRAPQPISYPHFPDTLHAVIWRNWDFINVNHLAKVLRVTPEQLTDLARSMGLPPQRTITPRDQQRNYMSILMRNWHLLPYEQLCELLNWDAAEMLYSLNEDDFMWVKLGGYKPQCRPVYYQPPTAETREKAKKIAKILKSHLGEGMTAPAEPPFGFVKQLERIQPPNPNAPKADGAFQVRMCYPYFLRFGDPLVGNGIDDIPEGYLSQLAACGVNAIWFQALLNKLAPWELAPELSAGWEERIANLNRLVQRCRKYGIDVILYLNEPRAMPPAFFDRYPHLRGVNETPDRAPYSPNVIALCTSTKEVQDFITNSVRHLFTRVPDLGGIFTITYSENLTNCYSRKYGIGDEYALRSTTDADQANAAPKVAAPCPRCKARGPQVINAEINTLIERGMRQAGSKAKLFWYVWSTPEEWIPGIIEKLPDTCWVLCISEWGKVFTRGDYTGKVNEYSISVIGPSEQSLRQWKLAQQRNLKTVAKMQAGTSFEMFLSPYLPATRNVAQHVSNLADAGVDALMLGWSLGGWPSTNLEVAAEMGRLPRPSVDEAMRTVAGRRFGPDAADKVVEAWNLLSEAFGEFPFDMSTVYNAPQCLGPANLFHPKPTGLPACMITFPYDDLDGWRGPYSVQTFQQQFEKMAAGWQKGVDALDRIRKAHPSDALEAEWRIAESCLLSYLSTANQIRYVRYRQTDPATCREILRDELDLARRMFDLVRQDSRIGFEATMQYAFARFDLAEKILNCEHLLQQEGESQ
ncbi:MAG: hypothetical protein IT446_05590 [Phycisphaerales bacterium]|nr:hypothetical protein [Phycisphaerales bacterium]